MEGGLVSPRTEGTPQGGPLSPLLSNILLDELDKELERRGHRFVRYADDCNVYVRSEAAGERVMASLERFLMEAAAAAGQSGQERGGAAVEAQVPRVQRDRHRATTKLRVAPQSVARLRETTSARAAASGEAVACVSTMEELDPVLRGWVAYFRLAEAETSFEELDQWLRRKLRCILWRQWKRPRTRIRELAEAGVDPTRGARRRVQRPRAVVERGRESHERWRSRTAALAPHGTREPPR